jgi:homoserine trans-succinylase
MTRTKEERKQYLKEYREKNKEKLNQRGREKYQRDKEKILQQQKEYKKTPQGKKINRIKNWRRMGVIFFDFNLLYEIYINTEYCELCNIELTEDKITTKTTKCLDHDHSITDYDNVRNIVCHSCNVKRG